MPLITIAIPTYNRLDILQETLEILAEQDGFHDPFLEIVISDNHSPIDPTPLLEAFQERHGRKLVLHRNKHNEGIDGNIHRVAEIATGKYVLFMSDDDILLPGTLRRLQHIVRSTPDLLFCFVNGYPFSGRYVPGVAGPPIIKLIENLETQSADEIIETIWIWGTFLSSFFVDRRAWIGVVDRQRYIGTDIYLTHVLYRLLAEQPERTKIVTAEAMMAARAEYTGSFRIVYAFGQQFMKLLCDDAHRLGFSAKALRAVKIKSIRAGLPPMLMMIRCGQKPRRLNRAELVMLLRYTWWEPTAWLWLFPLAILPRHVLVGMRSMRRWTRDNLSAVVSRGKNA